MAVTAMSVVKLHWWTSDLEDVVGAAVVEPVEDVDVDVVLVDVEFDEIAVEPPPQPASAKRSKEKEIQNLVMLQAPIILSSHFNIQQYLIEVPFER